MKQQQLREMIVRELPMLIEGNEAFRKIVLKISRPRFADKAETESRFDRMMDMFQRQQDLDAEKWEAREKKWEKERLEQQKKWDAWEKKWAEERLEQQEKWDAWETRWEENQKVIRNLAAEIKEQGSKQESGIGALGSRWGLHSEASFRNALKGILEDLPDIEVLNVNEYDDEGTVHGHPDQVEVDIIIKNGLLLICEIKSSISKSEMYTFERKVRFYENRHNAKATRMIAISPMVDDTARPVAKKLGIEVYSYAEDVSLT